MTDGSFAQALVKRDPEPLIVDPRSGVAFNPETADHEVLVEILLELERREKQLKTWRIAAEDELVRRHGDRRAAQVVGDYEVDVDRGFTRVWDAEDLQTVLADLFARQQISVQDWADVVTEVPKVDGRKAMNFLNRADGDVLVELRRCFHWEQKGRAKVNVTPVVSLEP